MFNISNDMVLNMTNSHDTYLRGLDYYTKENVEFINFNKKALTFQFIVYSSNIYRIMIGFDEDYLLKDINCTCSDSSNYSGLCKHQVACLLEIIDRDKKGKFNKVTPVINKNNDIKFILDFFKDKDTSTKTPVNLEINYEFKSEQNDNFIDSNFNFRIGEKKLYVIRNLKNFIEDLISKQDMNFGKDFVFNHNTHTFKDEDLPIIDFLKEMYDIEEISSSNSSYSYSGYGFRKKIFNDKRIYLTPKSLIRFFTLLENRSFNAKILDINVQNINILNKDMPISLNLSEKDDDLILNIDIKNTIANLSPAGEYFFYKDNIYKVSKEQSEYLTPLFRHIKKTKKKYVNIPKEYSEEFISDVLPYIDKAGKVSIDKNIENSIYKPDLKGEVYLDKRDDQILLNIKFNYDDISIDPFNLDNKSNMKDSRILIRDKKKENIIMNLIEESQFKIINNNIYIDDEDDIFNFMTDKLPKIQSVADVYYSESFRFMSFKDPSSFSGSLQLNNENNMLEFNFSIDGVENLELSDIFKSLKEKRKYHKLKDGSFLPLSYKELYEVNDILTSLNLDEKDFIDDIIKIPKFRALYLDDELSNSNLKFFKRNVALKQLVENIKKPNDIDYSIPCELNGILRNYQETGFKWLKILSSYGFGGILADDMGLGKTLQTITFLLSEKIEKTYEPSIIIAPTSLVYNWQSEIEKFAPSLRTLIISGNKSERENKIREILNYDIIITSYPLIRRDIDFYNDITFRYCILDEAQHIKNSSSLNSSSVKSINAKNRFALTGTPIENSLIELWSIFDFIMPGYLLSHSSFTKNFEKPIVKDGDKSSLDKLGKHIRPFILRRLKKDVLKELPDKIESKLVAELTDEQKKIYLAYLENIKNEIDNEINTNGFGRSHIKILAALTRLRQICCHPSMFIENYNGKSGKLILLEEIINDLIDGGHRVLLFSQFTSMLKIISDMLQKNNVEFMYLDGSTPMEKRGTMVNDFNNGKGEVFLISLKAGGTGLNLTGADTVIHFDPWWNPAVEEQATDRAHRIGQENIVHVMKLIAKGTIEEKIFALQEKKKKLIDSVIQPGETLVSKLSEEEIRDIFDI